MKEDMLKDVLAAIIVKVNQSIFIDGSVKNDLTFQEGMID
jgi:hypothetical protein